MEPPPSSLESAFELGPELGRGGFGVVLRGHRRADGRPVAIKLPHAQAPLTEAARIQREARLAESLHHPNLVRLLGCHPAEDGRLALVYELLEGEPLDQVLARGTPPRPRALQWLEGLAAGLDTLHAAGLVHRDVKAANAFVCAGDRAVLLDFGLARPEAPGQTLTATGVVAGTPETMAPEVLEGRPATAASDRYALACLATQLLTGYPPIEGDLAAILAAHAAGGPPRLRTRDPSLPGSLERAMTRALARDPGARPASAGALVASLREALAGATSPRDATRVLGATPPAPRGPASRLAPPPRRGLALGLGALVLAAGLWVGLRPAPRPPTASPRPTRVPATLWPEALQERLAQAREEAGLARLSRDGALVGPDDPGFGSGEEAVSDPLAWGLLRESPRLAALDEARDQARAAMGEGPLAPELRALVDAEDARWVELGGPRPLHPALVDPPPPAAVPYTPEPDFAGAAPWYHPPERVGGWIRLGVEAAREARRRRLALELEFGRFRDGRAEVEAFPLDAYPGGTLQFFAQLDLHAFVKTSLTSPPARRTLAARLRGAAENLHLALFAFARAIETGQEPAHAAVLGYLYLETLHTLVIGSYLEALRMERVLGPGRPNLARGLLEFQVLDKELRRFVDPAAEFEARWATALRGLERRLAAEGEPIPGLRFLVLRQVRAERVRTQDVAGLVELYRAQPPRAWLGTDPGMLVDLVRAFSALLREARKNGVAKPERWVTQAMDVPVAEWGEIGALLASRDLAFLGPYMGTDRLEDLVAAAGQAASAGP